MAKSRAMKKPSAALVKKPAVVIKVSGKHARDGTVQRRRHEDIVVHLKTELAQWIAALGDSAKSGGVYECIICGRVCDRRRNMVRHAETEKDQSTLLSTAEAPYFDENHPFVATCICICLLGHVFTCFPVGVACGVVAVARAMWLVQCAVSAQARCHMCAANKTYRCDSRTLWQHHVAMALPLLFLCVVYVLAFKKTYEWF